MGKYRVGVRSCFSAAHRIEGHEGKCKLLHGHTYIVECEVEGSELNEINMLIDISELRKVLNEVLEMYDHKYLNKVLNTRNATCEMLCNSILSNVLSRLLYTTIVNIIEKIKVRVYESPDCWVEVVEEVKKSG